MAEGHSHAVWDKQGGNTTFVGTCWHRHQGGWTVRLGTVFAKPCHAQLSAAADRCRGCLWSSARQHPGWKATTPAMQRESKVKMYTVHHAAACTCAGSVKKSASTHPACRRRIPHTTRHDVHSSSCWLGSNPVNKASNTTPSPAWPLSMHGQ